MEWKKIFKIPFALRRGFAHIFIGLSITIIALFLPRVLFLSLLGTAAFLFLFLEFIRFISPKVNKWFCSFFSPILRTLETSHITGASYLLLASLLSFLVFARDIAVVSVCFLAVGDSLATIIGEGNNRRKLFKKTLDGDIVCLFACLIVGFILHYVGLDVSLVEVGIGAIIAAITEALPLPIDDNVTIPIFAGLVMTLIRFVS